MKRKCQTFLLKAIALLLLVLLLPSCASNEDTHEGTKPEVNNASESVKAPTDSPKDITTDSYEEKIAYYAELVESLQSELSKLKESSYISEVGYLLTIKELQGKILDLKSPSKDTGTEESEALPLPEGVSKPTAEIISKESEYYYIINDGKVTVLGYNGNATNVNIPKTIEGHPVQKIGDGAFKGSCVTAVSIPSGVTSLGWFAFDGCASLSEVSIPTSVESIDYGAFDNCPQELTVHCQRGSYAEAYAKSWGIRTVTE